MGDLTNSVAVVTGAARGQGRSHAVALAAEGADIIAIDRCADIESIPYPLATKADLDETVELVRATGRRAVPVIADVRDLAPLQAGVQAGVDELGEIDIVVANAGVVAIGRKDPTDEQLYRDIVDTNLNGVWHTIAATVPSIIRKGKGGSIILISSVSGMVGRGGDGSAAMFAYTASKHGVVGLMRSAANAYAALARMGEQTASLGRSAAAPLVALGKLVEPLFLKSVPQGAATQSFAATNPSLEKVSGEYFVDCNIGKPGALARDAALAARLWDESERIVERL